MPGIPANITIEGRTPATIKGRVAPLINTAEAARGGFRASGPDAPEFTVGKTDTTITATITNGYGAESYESRIGTGAWSAGLTVSDLTAETAYSFQVRGIDSAGTGLAASASVSTRAVLVGVLFSENFDDQPDFTSTLHSTQPSQKASQGDTLPTNWDEIYQSTDWSPEKGYPDQHASIEILAANTDKARGGVGKSMVNWRESAADDWNSDSQMIHLLDEPQNELYIEFWISFSDNWWQRNPANQASWASKLFRIGSWDGVGDIVNGALGHIGPTFFWDYKRDKYNLQNFLHFRGGPWGENYYMNFNEPSYPRYTATNFGSNTLGMAPNGEDPLVVNQIDGGYLKDIGRYTQITHEQLFGAGGHWTKMAFYVKMNSAPGVADGVLQQWVNDQRIRSVETIPWIKANSENKMIGWNYFALGGNDSFRPFPADQFFEDWYAFDDLIVRDSLPESLV